jgi:DNA cross-link repair 1C protein
MSTFHGLISEFPDIRVDFFRQHADRRPPLVCFLSHIHSDHLAGLESYKSPFIYCSPATRQMLPCLEKHPCRINYAKGILEARVQTYKHLRALLKPLPLNTPTTLEPRPGNVMCVTLLDANHCPGAVMFLFERPGAAVLYTGDIRSEPWFVNSLVRNPALIEYTQGLRTLDKIYLDTSFVDEVDFQTKAEGLQELLRKVARYPEDTVFYIQAWTYG